MGKFTINNEGDVVSIETGEKAKMQSTVHYIGYVYCMKANEELKRRGYDGLIEPLMLREGAGAMLVRRLQTYGTKEVMRRLALYIESDKFQEHPSLNAALSGPTYTAIEMDKLK